MLPLNRNAANTRHEGPAGNPCLTPISLSSAHRSAASKYDSIVKLYQPPASATRPQHVELQLHLCAIGWRNKAESTGRGLELQRYRRGQQVTPNQLLTGRLPEQAADSDDEFQLLATFHQRLVNSKKL